MLAKQANASFSGKSTILFLTPASNQSIIFLKLNSEPVDAVSSHLFRIYSRPVIIPEKGNPMGIYSTFSRGFGVDQRHILDVQKILSAYIQPDFMVAGGYDGVNIDQKVGANIDAANALGIPCIVLARLNPDYYLGWVSDPAPENDYHIQALDRIIFMNGKPGSPKRRIAGIMLDARKVTQANGNHVTQQNWVRAVNYYTKTVWARYSIGFYVLMSQSVINQMPPDSQNSVQEQVTRLDSHCCIAILPGQVPVSGDWNVSPIPPDTWKPEYIGNVRQVYFSLISDGIITLNGVSGAPVAEWQYATDKAHMLANLPFTPSTPSTTPTTNPTIPTTPTNTPSPIDLASILQQLAKLQADVDAIKARLNM